MKYCVLNKQGQFGVAIFMHYTDITIFVLDHFIQTHPVYIYTYTYGKSPIVNIAISQLCDSMVGAHLCPEPAVNANTTQLYVKKVRPLPYTAVIHLPGG